MKYTVKDVENMIDTFGEIIEKKDSPEDIIEELEKLIDYPIPVLQEFLNCMEIFSKKTNNEEYVKENYWGVIGYVVMRLNLIEDPVNDGQEIW